MLTKVINTIAELKERTVLGTTTGIIISSGLRELIGLNVQAICSTIKRSALDLYIGTKGIGLFSSRLAAITR